MTVRVLILDAESLMLCVTFRAHEAYIIQKGFCLLTVGITPQTLGGMFMKKRYVALISILLLCAVAGMAAAETFFTITMAEYVESVALTDDEDHLISSVISTRSHDGMIEWTLRVQDSNTKSVQLAYREKGVWLPLWRMPREYVFGNEAVSPAGNTASSNPWPEKTYSAKRTSVRDLPSNKRHQSRLGPSKSYHGGGAYKSYKISSIKALFIEDGWVYADLDYTTVGRRRLYFAQSIFTGSLSGVPEVSLKGYSAKTTSSLTPRFGPGSKYDSFDEGEISSGTRVTVFFEEDGWVFGEFDCSLGTVRAWIPAEKVRAV